MSKIEVNQISSQCGATLTIGQSGDTVTLAAGATQTGFGRTGTVDWCTTAKTAPFTGVSGKGYFVNTTCGAVTVTLPASPTAGDIISVADYASTWNTNNVTLCRNSSKINGGCFNSTLSTKGQSITLVYVDGTRGWKNTMDSTSNITGAPNYILACGGTITTCGNYKIHTFTSDGTFTITSAPTPANNNVDYLVIAGGGAGGNDEVAGAGGGAGGFRESHTAPVSGCYTASPLASGNSLPVSVQAYPITVGAGGAGEQAVAPIPACNQGNPGSNSSFSTITATGGGAGGSNTSNPAPSGGSGGGAVAASGLRNGGSGNTPPTTPPQGNSGGDADNSTTYRASAGGGGAGATGTSRTSPSPGGNNGGPGGNGVATSITGTPTSYAGGGGGSADNRLNPGYTQGTGGTGGGGNGGDPANAIQSGTANTGGGGGGNRRNQPNCGASGSGGSGIVIIRYKFQ